jgi:hypothetical protein
MRKLEVLHPVSATRLVMLSRLIVLVINLRQLCIFLDELPVFEKLDASSHELMDLKSKI